MRIFFGILMMVVSAFILSTLTNNTEVLEAKDSVSLNNYHKAMFAGGCFWCMEKPFEKKEGVISVTSGYAGGTSENPNYNNYMQGGHVEVVEVVYDPQLIKYETLLDIFWRQIDPTDAGGQFVDRGHAYSSAIYYSTKEEKLFAEKSRDALAARKIYKKKIVTPIVATQVFWPAEEYHQDYYKKNKLRYSYYRSRSGRDTFLNKIWGEKKELSDESDLKNKLTPLQYKVTQENGTEPPFKNKYWDNKKAGIYVDIISNEPLFSSVDKYDSGTGWPSFSKPLDMEQVIEKKDNSLFMTRIEVRSKNANSHLGHLFNDGPKPTGKRYCINSASLRFIPLEDLAKEDYAEYITLFESQKSN